MEPNQPTTKEELEKLRADWLQYQEDIDNWIADEVNPRIENFSSSNPPPPPPPPPHG